MCFSTRPVCCDHLLSKEWGIDLTMASIMKVPFQHLAIFPSAVGLMTDLFRHRCEPNLFCVGPCFEKSSRRPAAAAAAAAALHATNETAKGKKESVDPKHKQSKRHSLLRQNWRKDASSLLISPTTTQVNLLLLTQGTVTARG